LFRNAEASRLIVKCNDFGAGGVSVAIGELAPGLDIWLETVPKKYDGLTATELAISESQERMAVVIPEKDVAKFVELAGLENLKATVVAEVTDDDRLTMYYKDEIVCDIERAFLDTNGIRQETNAEIVENNGNFFKSCDCAIQNVEEKLTEKLAQLNVCSQKGLGEVFDSTIGCATVLMPFGGERQLTPAAIMASKPPVGKAFTHTVTCSSYGIYTDLLMHSPFEGAVYSIVGAVSKLVSAGVPLSTIRLSLQEFFKKLGKDATRWGEPTSALLGAFAAQMGLKLGAIGGKDSMSGTYENIDVPPTLIAFAMGIVKDYNLVHNTFKESGKLYRFKVPRNENGTPEFDKLREMYNEITALIESGKVLNTCVSDEGGALASVIKSTLGNRVGFIKNDINSSDFAPSYGDIFVLTREELANAELYGEVCGNEIILNGKKIEFDVLEKAFTGTLESVFPTTADAKSNKLWNAVDTRIERPIKAKASIAKPKVFIPVFPGTNCEFDMAKAFERAGAEADIFVIRNLSGKQIEESISEMAKRIAASQIIAFPGGFSGGDEPDGSGKFIATTFSNAQLKDAVNELLYKRDGLVLGICNGFQALIKLGLLPYGEIKPLTENSPTLTFNRIMRHVSTIAKVRVATNNSPWLNLCKTGEIYNVPVSHGEGRILCNDNVAQDIVNKDLIATQYVDNNGIITMQSPFNPNGSVNAIEGLISPDGRVLGKMGHTERFEKGLYGNIDGNFEMPIFKSAVKYYE